MPRATPPLLKNLNERTVLEAIRAGAPISRAEISRRAGISKPTVSQALQSLVTAGLVQEAPHDGTGRSYGAVFFEPVAEAALVVGLDVGARFVRGAICDLRGQVRARQDVELGGRSADAALETIVELVPSLVDGAGLPAERIDGAVVGIPGAVDVATGRISLAENVGGLEERDFRGELAERLELPVTLENDINLAALGEQWLGVARGVDDFVFLSVGTGLGAGLVLRGELHRGQHGTAGELDFVSAGLEDDIDPCAGALAGLAETLAAERATALGPPYDGRAIFAAARGGDEVARTVVDELARRIALHVVPVASVTDVALVVLGGGLGANGDLLLDRTRALLADWLPYPPQLTVSSLGEAAVLMGALAVGLQAALDSVFANRGPVAARV